MSVDDDRLAGLARTKLEGLVHRAFPDVTERATSFPAGAAIRGGDSGFVYLVKPDPSPLGAALAWGSSVGVSDLHLIVDADDPALAHQLGGFAPPIRAWRAIGTDLVAATAEVAVDPAVPPEAAAHVPTLEAAGCEIAIEHGVVVGEILGLEVARVVVEVDGSATVRVGVGLYDQEAHALVHAKESVEERLEQVVTEVRRHRRLGAPPHPINRVARQRWLRSLLLADPGFAGLDRAEAVAPLRPRGGIHEEGAVAASGRRGASDVVAVTAVGIDLDAVPCAAGHLERDGADLVVLVMPPRDHHDVIRRQAERLRVPAELLAVDAPWA